MVTTMYVEEVETTDAANGTVAWRTASTTTLTSLLTMVLTLWS